nr:ABC transporter ATP-binding protein [Oscillospiraceae bacterium]
MALLEVKRIHKEFGGLKAVNDVSFHVEEGEIVSIIGPNGAGKTTMFNLITGAYTIDKGTVFFQGEDITNKKPQQIVVKGIARTFQNIKLCNNMRVIENVLIGMDTGLKYSLLDLLLRTPKFRKAEQEKHAEAIRILKAIGLGERIHEYAGNLPYGERRKLEIARAIATGAKLLLLDEPAAGMNENESAELMGFISLLRQSGYTILLIEHDMQVVMNISDRIYVLDYGILISQGKPEEIAADPNVIKAYLGEDETDA